MIRAGQSGAAWPGGQPIGGGEGSGPEPRRSERRPGCGRAGRRAGRPAGRGTEDKRGPPARVALAPGDPAEMPVRSSCRCPPEPAPGAAARLEPPPPINTAQPGVSTSRLYSGAKFRGQQRSKGNAYEVEVVVQVSGSTGPILPGGAPTPPPAPAAFPLARGGWAL